jgi:hypothetical protein
MEDQPDIGTCRLSGKVIESFEGNGVHRLRLIITGGDIEIPVETRAVAHLGDTLRVEGNILLTHLTTNPELIAPLIADATRRKK